MADQDRHMAARTPRWTWLSAGEVYGFLEETAAAKQQRDEALDDLADARAILAAIADRCREALDCNGDDSYLFARGALAFSEAAARGVLTYPGAPRLDSTQGETE